MYCALTRYLLQYKRFAFRFANTYSDNGGINDEQKENFSKINIRALSLSLLVGCGSNVPSETNSKFNRLDTDLKVGMVVGSGTIDDRSFNQGSWEGITATVKNSKYVTSAGKTESDYLVSIGNLIDGGINLL